MMTSKGTYNLFTDSQIPAVNVLDAHESLGTQIVQFFSIRVLTIFYTVNSLVELIKLSFPKCWE